MTLNASPRLSLSGAAAAAALLLSACSSGGSPPASMPSPSPSPAPSPTPTPTPSASLTFQPHAGLEILVGGDTVGAQKIMSNPGATLTDTETGFTLNNATFNTPRTASVTSYSGCSRCIGSGLSTDQFDLTFTSDQPSSLQYATYGVWEHTQSVLHMEVANGVFAGGTMTTATDRPTSGSATYTGGTAGFISFDSGTRYSVTGTITLNADFAANAISGQINGANAALIRTSAAGRVTDGPVAGVNTITLSGGTITGTTFAGTAAAVDIVPGTPGVGVNISGTRGAFGGAFYGPGAAEAGGSLALTGASTNVIMSFGAKK